MFIVSVSAGVQKHRNLEDSGFIASETVKPLSGEVFLCWLKSQQIVFDLSNAIGRLY